MKVSRNILTNLWNQVLDFTPVLNFKDDWKKGSTPRDRCYKTFLERICWYYLRRLVAQNKAIRLKFFCTNI